MSDRLRIIHDLTGLFEITPDDPFVRWECDARNFRRAWALGSAVGFLRQGHHGRRTHLNVIGPAADVDGLLGALQQTGLPEDAEGISVDLDLLPVAESHFPLEGGGDWDWMWTTVAPPGRDDRVVRLDDTADAEALRELNRLANPIAESRPGEGVTELWLGIRDGDRILAAGAMHRTAAGAPHLSGIVTLPQARGRGYGEAVVAALTRAGVADSGICTLGMYADNDVARRLYYRLGYQTAHLWASRGFAQPINPCERFSS